LLFPSNEKELTIGHEYSAYMPPGDCFSRKSLMILEDREAGDISTAHTVNGRISMIRILM